MNYRFHRQNYIVEKTGLKRCEGWSSRPIEIYEKQKDLIIERFKNEPQINIRRCEFCWFKQLSFFIRIPIEIFNVDRVCELLQGIKDIPAEPISYIYDTRKFYKVLRKIVLRDYFSNEDLILKRNDKIVAEDKMYDCVNNIDYIMIRRDVFTFNIKSYKIKRKDFDAQLKNLQLKEGD